MSIQNELLLKPDPNHALRLEQAGWGELKMVTTFEDTDTVTTVDIFLDVYEAVAIRNFLGTFIAVHNGLNT